MNKNGVIVIHINPFLYLTSGNPALSDTKPQPSYSIEVLELCPKFEFLIWMKKKLFQSVCHTQFTTFYLLIANVFAKLNIGGTKEFVVLLWLSGNI